MRRFGVLLRKELRELMTVQMLLPLLVTIVMFGLIGNLVGGQTTEGGGAAVHVVDADGSAASERIVGALADAGFIVVTSPGTDPAAAAATDDGPGTSIYIGIPAGFGAGLASGQAQKLTTYTVMRNFSFFAARDAAALNAALDAANRSASLSMISAATTSTDPAALRDPISLSENVIIGDRSAPVTIAAVTSFITGQTTFIPIVLFIVIMFAASMIASTVASEKENKTLETLLAAPIGRAPMVLAKMAAASLVALVSSAAYLFGMQYYMSELGAATGGGAAVAGGAGAAMDQLGLTLGAGEWALLFASLFLGILVALAIAVILGAFAENVRAVQALLTPLTIAVMIPYFLTIFVDLDTTTPLVRAIVLAIPFTHPFRAAPALFLRDYGTVWLGIGYQALWCAAAVFVATKVFASDRILTLRLGRRKSAAKERP
ncbi:MAG TPA: ABC transporter permease [Coriobacteriia bacterium]